MTDFEVHPIGYGEEIRLSRALARAIDENIQQYGQVVPNDVYNAFVKLKQHYQKQMEHGIQ